jgi:hypothetical protein
MSAVHSFIDDSEILFFLLTDRFELARNKERLARS